MYCGAGAGVGAGEELPPVSVELDPLVPLAESAGVDPVPEEELGNCPDFAQLVVRKIKERESTDIEIVCNAVWIFFAIIRSPHAVK